MWPFKKKKIYKVEWCYMATMFTNITLVKAYNEANAWKYVQNLYDNFISLVKIEEFKGE